MVMNYRNQWSGIGNPYRTFAFGGDHYAYGMRSGLGMSIWRDVAGVNQLAFTHYSAYFAHKIKISKTQAIKAGIRLSHVTRSVDTSRMLFADQVIRDNASATVEPNLLERVSYQEIGMGFLYHSQNWWTGLSIGQVNRPNTSLMDGGEVPMPVRWSLHGGALVHNRKGRISEAVKIAYEYKAMQKWDQLDVGAYYRYERFVLGMWYRGLPVKRYAPGYANHDALVFLLGLETENNWKFGYSYDMTISQLTIRSGGSHEISISYEIPNKARRRKIKVPPCMEW